MKSVFLCVLILFSVTYSLIAQDLCQEHEFPKPSIEERVTNRTFPSVYRAWQPILSEDITAEYFYQNPVVVYTNDEYNAYSDLLFSDLIPYEHAFIRNHITPEQPFLGLSTQFTIENVTLAKASHQQRLRLNPNHIYLVVPDLQQNELRMYPDNPDFWYKDVNGHLLEYPDPGRFYLNILNPEVQENMIKRAVSYDECGIFDGIMIDEFAPFNNERKGLIDPNRMTVAMGEAYMDAYVKVFREIRNRVSDDFLILVNAGSEGKIEPFKKYINGSQMECVREPGRHYSHQDLTIIEDTLTWNEQNLRYPQINCLEGFGLETESPDGPNNQRWMRVFTTLSLTHSNGYVLYNRGDGYVGGSHHLAIWYDFWDAPLGRPVGAKAQPYEDQEGLFIREFTNGWAVYNRSGKEQQIALPESVSGWASGITGTQHTLPDLDGEIYLKQVTNPADLNSDGIVNILDLVVIAGALGNPDGPDLNGDGIVNILDLVVIAKEISK